MDPRLLEQIHAEVDGENTAAESADLRRRLSDDPRASRLLEELHQLSKVMASDGTVDAPAELRRRILNEIAREREAHFAAPPRTKTKNKKKGIQLPGWLVEPFAAWKEDGMSKKTLIWAASVAVVAVAVGYVGMRYSDGNEPAEGTIRPAERYEADQIAAEDVQLGDTAVQDFMQSEVFEEWINDPNSPLHDELLMTQLKDPLVAQILSDKAVVDLISKDHVLRDPAFIQKLTDIQALKDPAFVDLISKSHILRDPAFLQRVTDIQAMKDPAFVQKLSELTSLKDAAVVIGWAQKGYFSDPAFEVAIKDLSKTEDPAFVQTLSAKSPLKDAAFVQRLSELSSLKDPAFLDRIKVMRDPAFVQRLSEVAALKDPAFVQRVSEIAALKDPAFIQRLSEVPSLKDAAFAMNLQKITALGDPAFVQRLAEVSALKDPALLQKISDHASSLKDPAFAAVLSNPTGIRRLSDSLVRMDRKL